MHLIQIDNLKKELDTEKKMKEAISLELQKLQAIYLIFNNNYILDSIKIFILLLFFLDQRLRRKGLIQE